jgi:serralysin
VTTLQGDTNGDGAPDFAIDLTGNISISLADLIGAYSTPVVIEANGSTSLVQLGNNYYFYPVGGNSGPIFKYNGVPVGVGQYASLTYIAAEQTASGYQVAIKVQGADQYTVWNTDINGNFVSNGTGGVVVSGSSSVLTALEPSFHQDLNGDGVIGAASPAVTVIESFGATSLVQVDNSYYFYPVGGSSGPQFKYGGAPVGVGQYASLTYLGAEQTASGYAVAIKVQGADQYTVWNTDINGNFVSNGTGGVVVSGASSVLIALEPNFQQDLNGDGVIGGGAPPPPAGTVIESFGSTSLVQLNNNFYFYPVGGSSGPQFKYSGSPVTASGQYASVVFLGAEQTASGYAVALKVQGADQYTIWNTDNNGNFVSNGTGGVLVSGQSSVFRPYETVFHQDLNGDSAISVSALILSASSSQDSFVFRTDSQPSKADGAGFAWLESRGVSGTAVHDQVEALVSILTDSGLHLTPASAVSDALTEHHVAALLLGHVIVQ